MTLSRGGRTGGDGGDNVVHGAGSDGDDNGDGDDDDDGGDGEGYGCDD